MPNITTDHAITYTKEYNKIPIYGCENDQGAVNRIHAIFIPARVHPTAVVPFSGSVFVRKLM